MRQVHVVPGDAESGDGPQHELSTECWCGPAVVRVGREQTVTHVDGGVR